MAGRNTIWIRRLLWVSVLLMLVWECGLLAQVLWWRTHDPSLSAFMQRQTIERARTGRAALLPHPWVSYQRIPNSLKRAVVAEEDSDFMHHHGFDWKGVRLAFDRDLKRGKVVAGGSTITQQLAKNLFLSERRSLWRKGQEALITVMLETFWSKRRILEVYLNLIEWGDGVYGCEGASQHYFNVTVARLSAEQSARLASMIPNPRFYDRHGPTGHLTTKTETIEERMNQVEIPR